MPPPGRILNAESRDLRQSLGDVREPPDQLALIGSVFVLEQDCPLPVHVGTEVGPAMMVSALDCADLHDRLSYTMVDEASSKVYTGGMQSELGAELRKARQSRGLSLQTVAIPADVSAAYLHKLEQGKVDTPSPRSLRRIGDELGIPYVRLLRLIGYLEEADLVPGYTAATASPNPLAEYELSEAELKAVTAFVRLLVEQRDEV